MLTVPVPVLAGGVVVVSVGRVVVVSVGGGVVVSVGGVVVVSVGGVVVVSVVGGVLVPAGASAAPPHPATRMMAKPSRQPARIIRISARMTHLAQRAPGGASRIARYAEDS
jgi:hypothetical protein